MRIFIGKAILLNTTTPRHLSADYDCWPQLGESHHQCQGSHRETSSDKDVLNALAASHG